jgi:hypothetical protein
MTSQAKKNLEREIRKLRHQTLTDFNMEHRGVSGEERAALKARLNEGLDRLEAFMRSQPEPSPEPPNPYKPPKTRRKSRMIYDR